MTISRVQGAQANSSGSVTSQAITLPSGITLGNLIVACVATGSNNTTFTGPSGWTQAVINQPAGASATIETSIWYMVVGAGHVGETSWTWTLSASHSAYICISEWASTTGWQASPVDVSAQGDTAGTPVTATTIVSGTTSTTAQASELWIASLAYKGSAQSESSITAGWTKDLESTLASNNTMTMLYQVASATGAAACQYSIGSAQFWAGVAATFMPASAGGGGSALTLYGSNVSDANLTTASSMSTTTGGTEVSQATNATGVAVWVEVLSRAATIATVSAIGSPSDKGWVFSPGAGVFAAGNWSVSITLSATSPGTTDVTVRFYKLSSGVHTLIGSVNKTGVVGAKTTYSFTPTSFSSVTFASGDLLVRDVWWHDLSGADDNPIIYESNSATQGVTSDVVTTSVFTPASNITGTSQELLFDVVSGVDLGTNTATSQESIIDAQQLAGTNSGTSQELLFNATGSTTLSNAALGGTSQELLFNAISGTDLGTNTATNQESLVDAPGLAGISTATSQLTSFTVNAGTETGTNTGTAQETFTALSGIQSGVNTGFSILTSFDASANTTSFVILGPDAVTVSVASDEDVLVREGTFSIDDAIDERSTASFTLRDSTGLIRYQKGDEVVAEHNNLGVLFAGVVNTGKERVLYPNPEVQSGIQAVDDQWFSDKRLYTGPNHINRFAGDILTDLLPYLEAEGITASYASRRDASLSNFVEGTLTNVEATEEGLQLAPAGSSVAYAEPDDNDFTTGSLIQVTGASTLQPTSTPAIKLQAQMSVPGATSAYTWAKVWSGTSATISTNPHLQYQIYIDPACPEAKFAIDLVFSDGKKWSDTWVFYTDGENLSPLASTDLTGLATTGWYSRDFFLGDYIGKSIVAVMVGCGGLKTGSYTGWFKDILIIDNSHTTSFSMNVNPPQQLQSFGYSSTSVSQVQTYDLFVATAPAYGALSTRDTPSISLGSVNILKSSFISWEVDEPDKTAFVMKYSLDGASYPTCTNNAPLPYLPAGTSLAGKSIIFESQFYALPGASPEVCPILKNWSVQFQPSYQATKSDTIYSIVNASDWSGGTLTNVVNQARVLTLNGAVRNFDDGSTDNTLLYTTNAQQIVNNRSLQLNVTNGVDARARMDFAGQYQNFTAGMDVKVDVFQSGFVYRCTNWQNNNNTFAYSAMMTTTQVQLGRGTNSTSGTGSFTSISTATLALTAGDVHRLEIVISGTSHKVYVDGILFINTTDSTYSAAGYIGIRCNNTTASGCSALFDNFGVVAALSGTWISPNIPLSGAANYGNSIIFWRDRSPSFNGSTNTSTLVEASINGGITWLACTNGAALSNFTAGQSLSGINLKLRVTLTSSTASSMPALDNLTVKVLGAFSATGTRISPALDLSPVGRAGATLAAWTATLATGATLKVEIGPNTSTWTDVSGSNGGEIPFIDSQPAPFIDTFDADSSSDYTSTSRSGGSVASYTWNTTARRLDVVGGQEALLVFNPDTTFLDGEITFDTDQADQAGFFLRYQNANNYYDVAIYDNASTLIQNNMQIYRVSGGVRTLLTAASIDFKRGIIKRIKGVIEGSTITLFFDGALAVTYSDSTPLTVAGKCGVRAGLSAIAGTSHINQFIVQNYGEDCTGQSVYSKLTLTSTDPTVSPIVPDLSVSAHNPDIQNGALIPQTDYSGKKQIGECIADLASKSNYWWTVRRERIAGDLVKKLIFKARTGEPSAWILSSLSGDLLVNGLTVTNQSDLYRNRQYVRGAIDPNTGIETTVMREDAVEQAAFALIEKGSGIVENSIDVTGQNMSVDAAEQLAQSTLDRYKVRGRTIAFQTRKHGLKPGQLQTVFISQHGIADGLYLINRIKTTLRSVTENGVSRQDSVYSVEASEGPNLGSWAKLFVKK